MKAMTNAATLMKSESQESPLVTSLAGSLITASHHPPDLHLSSVEEDKEEIQHLEHLHQYILIESLETICL